MKVINIKIVFSIFFIFVNFVLATEPAKQTNALEEDADKFYKHLNFELLATTQGLGASVGYKIKDNIYLRLQFNRINANFSDDIDFDKDSKINKEILDWCSANNNSESFCLDIESWVGKNLSTDISVKLSQQILMLDWAPNFWEQRTLWFQFGVAQNISNASFSTYTNITQIEDLVNTDVEIKMRRYSPYLGVVLRVNNPYGVYASLSYGTILGSTTTDITNNTSVTDAVKKVLQNSVATEFTNVIAIGIGYNF